MCLDVVFGSCRLPGTTADAHVEHEVNFLFRCKGKKMAVIFLTFIFLLLILCTFSQRHRYEENGCNSLFKPIMSEKLAQRGVLSQGFEVH